MVSVWRGFLFLWVLGMGYVILLWHSLSLPYNYFVVRISYFCIVEIIVYDSSDLHVQSYFTSMLEKHTSHSLVENGLLSQT